MGTLLNPRDPAAPSRQQTRKVAASLELISKKTAVQMAVSVVKAISTARECNGGRGGGSGLESVVREALLNGQYVSCSLTRPGARCRDNPAEHAPSGGKSLHMGPQEGGNRGDGDLRGLPLGMGVGKGRSHETDPGGAGGWV